MFREDQRIIAELALRDRSAFATVLKIAILSAQSPFHKLDKALKAERSGFAEHFGAANVTALKRESCARVDAESERLHKRYRLWHEKRVAKEISRLALMLELVALPGLGLVKAGFATQMLLGEVGCLDTHNCQRLGISMPQLDWRRSTLSLHRQVFRYIAQCEKAGGAEKLWNDWCCYVAKREPEKWRDAQDVSAWHWKLIDGDPLG